MSLVVVVAGINLVIIVDIFINIPVASVIMVLNFAKFCNLLHLLF